MTTFRIKRWFYRNAGYLGLLLWVAMMLVFVAIPECSRTFSPVE